MTKEDQKLLLRLVDMEDNLRGVAALHSFTCGIHKELAEEPLHFFAKEEDERACQRAQSQGESNSADATPNQ